MESSSRIRYEVEQSIATITFNRPDKLNALTFEMADSFVALVDEAAGDPGVRVVIVQGAGRAFTAGVDMNDHADVQSPGGKTYDDDRRDIATAAARWLRLWSFPKPLVVKAHGYCAAWGVEIAMHADIVFASYDCQFFFPSVRNGTGLPDSATTVYHLGPQWAKRLLLTGEAIDGLTAERIGLICQSFPANELDAATHDLARRLAALPPALLTQSKAVINQSVELMGRSSLQSFAERANAIARRDPEAAIFGEIVRARGLAAAIAWREDRLGRH